MDKETAGNIKLGLFVSIGLILLIISIYFIGSKKSMFSSTFKVYAIFKDVNGLQTGNNIRFLGIDIGTVKRITVISDSTIYIMMVIEDKYMPYLRKNAEASIGTDGLMGNKIINLRNKYGTRFNLQQDVNSFDLNQVMIAEFDTFNTVQAVETEEVLRSLSASSDNVKEITDVLKEVALKINNSNSLWKLLSDSIATDNLKQAIVNIKLTGSRSAMITGNLNSIVQDIKSGKGSVGALLIDTSLSAKLKQTIVDIQVVSDTMALVSGDLKNISQKIVNGEGTIGTLLMDTSFVQNLNKSLENIRNGSAGFNENMEALKHSFLLKRYFKKKEK